MRQIADHILDLVRNAVEAGTRELELMVAEDSQADRLEITVRDKGQGMDAQTLARVTDAFFTSRTT
ncbi:MAG: ATP-binding protein, partial [candidate division WS1 bacterium]|nr:ATP-binding protein [candidate division WS1 bacterium]